MNTIILNLNLDVLSWPFYLFLILYAGIILVIIAGLVLWSQYLKKTYYHRALSQKIKISNPFQVAYLRNGLKGYIRSVLFKLIQKGYLEVPRKGWRGYRLRSKSGHPSVKLLSKEEQTVYHYAVSQGNWDRTINYKELHEDLRLVTEDMDNVLTNYHLLYPKGVINRLNRIRAFFMLFVLSLGGYRYFDVKLKGHIWSLLAVGLVGMVLILHLARLNRVTKQGNLYLQTLKKRYDKPNAPTDDQHQLVKVSLLKDNKQAMANIKLLLKDTPRQAKSWSDLADSFVVNMPTKAQLKT